MCTGVVSSGDEAVGNEVGPSPQFVSRFRMVELHPYSFIRLHGVVLTVKFMNKFTFALFVESGLKLYIYIYIYIMANM
jgi:hypothetical protein